MISFSYSGTYVYLAMNGFLIDIVLSGLTYVILIYLIFRLMRQRKKGMGGDGGKSVEFKPPIIDLPPGICWPSDNIPEETHREEVLD